MSAGDRERAARALLLRAAEPCTTQLLRHVRKVGVEEAVKDIRRGVCTRDLDVAAYAARIVDVDGERELEAAAHLGIRLVCPGDGEWPLALDDLGNVGADCLGLWVRGLSSLAELSDRAVSIVGTRAPTDYGAAVARSLAVGLAESGWTVVSGLALGIDAAAHRGALAASGHTVAVLACGVDVPYPKAHHDLAAACAERGAVVSEHPLGTAPHRHRFLVRNRLIAALSSGTVVVEAAPRSGARSTARHAAELFRHVMAVPGPVTSVTSAGCHQLLRDRPDTVLVTKADEVLEQVGPLGQFAERVSGPVRRRDLLGPVVSRVFEAVPVHRPAPLQRIAITAGLRVETVAAGLAALAAAGLVAQCAAGWNMTSIGRDERFAAAESGTGELELGWW
ncbi:MAG TPA: DNA-processing protein DprA [Mycobacteriales bacterium]|jgi:DNA processing protein|nr:DNA-processing protein DprA [Mycobacteriales bacterium]